MSRKNVRYFAYTLSSQLGVPKSYTLRAPKQTREYHQTRAVDSTRANTVGKYPKYPKK